MATIGARVASLIACFVLLLLCNPFAAHAAEVNISCSSVLKAVLPCHGYLSGKAKAPPPLCCTSIHDLSNAADTPEKRKSVCNCLKDEAKSIPDLKPEPVSHLPHLCKVQVSFKFSLDMTCSDVH